MEKLKRVQADKPGSLLRLFQDLLRKDVKETDLFPGIKSLYLSLDDLEKEAFFLDLMTKIEVSKETLLPLLESPIVDNPDDPDWPLWVSKLRGRLYSPRLNLFRKIAHSPGGLKFLLDFRRDLLTIHRFSGIDLKPLDFDIVLLFELWFQEGFLFLEEISLDSAYRQIELIKNSDLVHPMVSIEEMGQRLGKDRRCFALYHRLIPYEPIIFIEVALSKGLTGNITDIIEKETSEDKEEDKDTAIFYSINSTQQGLTGLGLGKMLIGQVVDYLKKEKPGIRTFATLSPIPGFWEKYLKPVLEGKDQSFSLKQADIPNFFSKRQMARIMAKSTSWEGASEGLNSALLSLLSKGDWAREEDLKREMKQPLIRIAYHYIRKEKNPRGKPLNPVANFHLGNGATVTQKNMKFLGNPTPRGLKDSCGLMVNYIYTSTWLSQIRRSFRWLDKTGFHNLFSGRH